MLELQDLVIPFTYTQSSIPHSPGFLPVIPSFIRDFNFMKFKPIPFISHLKFLEPDNKMDVTKAKYTYDFTAYMLDPKLRLRDSKLMATIFDSLFDQFISKHQPDLSYPDIPFREAFGGTRRCLQFLKTPDDIFKYYFTMAQVTQPNCIEKLLGTSLQRILPFFSFIKAYIHTHIDTLPPISFCYTELDTIAGYPRDSLKSQTDNPFTWLSGSVPDLHNEEWWAGNILDVLMTSNKQNTDPILSFEQFLAAPWLWTTDGATTFSKLLLGGKTVKTKFGAAVSLTTRELMACVTHALNPNEVNINIFVKADERGFKRRLIANMDLGSYLIAAYVRYLVEHLCGQIPSWMVATTSPNLDARIMQELKLGKEVFMPLDESQFDHNVSHQAWIGFLHALNTVYPDNLGLKLFEILLSNSKWYDRLNNTCGEWTKGQPSGLALTSMANTLFNYVKQRSLISNIHLALGDDALTTNPGYSLEQIATFYDTFGAEVNPKKNWLSTKYAEFLHFLYAAHGRTGLPARIYGSLIYGVKFTDSSPLMRINELATMFKDFYDRALLYPDFNLIAADLSRAVSTRWAGFNKQSALQWLHIPKVLQGFGFLPYLPKKFVVKNEEYETEQYSGALLPLAPKRTVTKSSFRIENADIRGGGFKFGNPLSLPKIETLQQWFDMLNLDVKGYTPFQLKYGSSVIPLPEIPFISSSRLSHLAAQWKFNNYPNMSGSMVSFTRRVITGSILLAEFTLTWFKHNGILIYI